MFFSYEISVFSTVVTPSLYLFFYLKNDLHFYRSSSNSVPVQMSIEGEAIEMATIRRIDDINITPSDPSNSSEEKNSQVEVNLINKQGKLFIQKYSTQVSNLSFLFTGQLDQLTEISRFGSISTGPAKMTFI